VPLAKQVINLNYRSTERFQEDYKQLSKGHLFLPAKKILPRKTIITLHISVPGINQVFVIDGAVISSLDPQTAEKLKKPPGMLVGVMGGPEAIDKVLAGALRGDAQYRDLLGLEADETKTDTPVIDNVFAEIDDLASKSAEFLRAQKQKGMSTKAQETDVSESKAPEVAAEAFPPDNKTTASQSTSTESTDEDELGDPDDTGLSIEWLKRAIAQEEVTREEEREPEVIAAPIAEKKDLTMAERGKVKPVADFIMDLTKAMLRSGYYSTDHPGAQDAKRGLYSAFQNSLGDSSEIMISNQETRERSDILITGILDEPVNVRTLVGIGQAELFVPKLREYFNLKGLVSFAIKKQISLEHFESFVDIMSDPQAERGENAKVGELLSNALVEHGITEISTVFMDDMIALELNLPWRVEMAIQRLAKDLKVLPMFQKKSDDSIREMKLQIIQDIIRPLKHPEFLKDLIINCYIIAKHVETVDTEDIEKVIIEAFPMDTLLPTSRYIFDELNRLGDMSAESPDNPVVQRRLAGIKRILIWVSRRLVMADVSGAQSFLEQLYEKDILTFEELPADVQYLVNTMKIANDVQAHFSSYVFRILNASTVEDATVILKCFRRVMPAFVENGNWDVALTITKAVDSAGRDNKVFSKDSGLPPTPQKFIFKNLTTELFEAYSAANERRRQTIGQIIAKLDSLGIEVLSRVLSDSNDRTARKAATDILIRKGDMSRTWVLNVLDDPKQPWFVQRNALMILRHVGKQKGDFHRARKLLDHSHPGLRDEALNAILALKAGDAEQPAIAALDDPDDKVRWRATSALADLAPLKDESVDRILTLIRTDPPEDKDKIAKHVRQVSQLIGCLGRLKTIRDLPKVEHTILEVAQNAAGHKEGFLKRLKKSSESEQSAVISAAVTTLGKIGTPTSEAFLAKLAGSNSSQAKSAQKAVDDIHHRYNRQSEGAPA
jgi:HEAT repeat protein